MGGPATSAPGDVIEISVPSVPGAPGCALELVTDDGTLLADDFAWHPANGLMDPNPDGESSLISVDGDTALYRDDGGEHFFWTRASGADSVTPPPDFDNIDGFDGEWIVGTRFLADGLYPGLWHRTYGFVPVTSAMRDRWVVDVNAHGASIVQGMTSAGRVRAFLWRANGSVVPLGNPFGNGIDIFPTAINDSGLVVGYADSTTGIPRAWYWREGGPITPIGPADAPTRAVFVNEHGSIAGVTLAQLPSGFFDVAFLWTERRGFVPAAYPISPYGLTEHDQVVGVATQHSQAVIWDPIRGHLTLSDNKPSFAYDMNDNGRVVGCDVLTGTAWDVRTVVRADWSAAEVARLAQLRAFFGYDTDEELLQFGVLVLAFINAIDPQPAPTPVVLDLPGAAASTVVTWEAAEMDVLNAVEQRWVVNDEDAHRWGFLVLSFIAAIQGH